MILSVEKYIFFASCFLGLFLFYNFGSMKPIATGSNTSSENNMEITWPENWNQNYSLDSAWETYINKMLRSPFSIQSEKKRLPTEQLALPIWQSKIAWIIPPIPGPAPEYWQNLSGNVKETLSEDDIRFRSAQWQEIAYKEPEKKLSILAQEIKNQVRTQDSIVLKGNKEYQGKIIQETPQEIIFSVKEQTVTFPKERIQSIQRIQTLSDAWQAKWSKSSQDPTLASALLEASLELGLEDIGKEHCNIVLEQHPDSPVAYIGVARFLEKNMQYDQSCGIYTLASKKGITSDSLKISEYELLAKVGLEKYAITGLVGMSNPTAWLKALEIAEKKNQWDKIAMIVPSFSKTILSTDDSVLYWQACLAMRKNAIEECLQLCQKIRNPTAKVHNLLGCSYYLQGKYKQAVVSLEKAIYEGHTFAVYNLAITYHAGGQPSFAIELLEKFHQHPSFLANPNIFRITLAYYLWLANPQSGEALQHAKIVSNCSINEVLTYYVLAKINTDEAALVYLQKALELDFQFHMALLDLAEISLRNNQITDAQNYLEQAQIRPFLDIQQIDIFSGLAQCAILQNNTIQAQQYLENNVQKNPKHIHSLKLRAWIHNQNNRLTEAIEDFTQVLVLQNDDEYSVQNKKRLQLIKTLVVWEDSFSRNDGPVRRRWQEVAKDGIEISIQKQKVCMSGVSLKGQSPAILYRNIDDAELYMFQAAFDVSQAPKSFIGIWYGQLDVETFCFAKTNEGRLAYAYTKSGKMDPYQIVGDLPKNSQEAPLVLAIQLVDKQLILSVNQQPIAAISQRNITKNKTQVGIFGMANSGELWQAFCDNVKIIEKQK